MDLFELISARTTATDDKPFELKWYVNEPTAIFLAYKVEGKKKHIRLDLSQKDIERLNEFICFHHIEVNHE